MLTLIEDKSMMVGIGEARRRRPQPRLMQRKLFRRKMEEAATRMALANPEIRRQVEGLAVGQSIEFKFLNGGSGAARRMLVLKVTRGLQDEVQFELRRGGASGLAVDQSAA
jgi:hypothetical protein